MTGSAKLEPSRLIRIPARDYFAAAAASQELARAVNDKAHERIGGLQNIAAEQRQAKVTMIGPATDACIVRAGTGRSSHGRPRPLSG